MFLTYHQYLYIKWFSLQFN